MKPIIEPTYDSNKSAPIPATSPTLSPTLSAQWEHTILVTHDGYEVLTMREEESGI